MVIKETEYLVFQVEHKRAKTVIVEVISKRLQFPIGYIRWYGPWRQYIFAAKDSTIWNAGCLQDIISVINQLMSEMRNKQ